jgi:homocysteine S-methyltransferase
MDGGVSTHLERLIAPQTFSRRELWSSSLLLSDRGKQHVLQGHNDWLHAGSDIITTVTYQCHYGLYLAEGTHQLGQKRTKIVPDEQMTQMIQDGISLARQATIATTTSSSSRSIKDVGPYVVASTGPYGAAMADGSEYTGNYPSTVTRQALQEFHTEKLQTIFDCHPDGIAVETIPNLMEVDVICDVVCSMQQQQQQQRTHDKRISNSVACWISFACRNGKELNDGNTLDDALRTVLKYDPEGRWIVAVGINCCDSTYIPSLVQILAQCSTITSKTSSGGGRVHPRGIVIYPNSGEDWDATNEEWKHGTGTTDTEFSDRLMDAVRIVKETWKQQRVSSSGLCDVPKVVLGGCCRTSEKTIAELRRRIDEWHLKSNG